MQFNYTETQIEIKRHRDSYPWTYGMLDARQREIAARVREGKPGVILLSEVAPVITIGRRTPTSDLLDQPDILTSQGIEIFRTDRGGLATYHGPGQWVLFVVDRLEALTGDRRGVRLAVEGLLNIALEVGRVYEPKAVIRSGPQQGVWGPKGKFAALGVHIQDGVLLHGIAINAYRTWHSFRGIRPCGLDEPVCFLLNDSTGARGAPEDRARAFDDMGERIIQGALKQFWKPKTLPVSASTPDPTEYPNSQW